MWAADCAEFPPQVCWAIVWIRAFPLTWASAFRREAQTWLPMRQGKAYRFLFVRADGVQLEKITQMVAANHIVPKIDSREFDLSQINNALNLVALGHTNGKVIVHFPE